MLHFSSAAKEQLNELIQGRDSSVQGLRFVLAEKVQPDESAEASAKQAPQKIQLDIVELTELSPEEEPLRDTVSHFFTEYESFLIIVNKSESEFFSSGLIDFAENTFILSQPPEQAGFTPLDQDDPLVEKIQGLLDNEINPGLAMHGGFAQLLGIQDRLVYLRFGGGCQGCSQIDVTVKQGVETKIRQAFPQIKGVIDQTNHAAGANPFY